MQKTKTINWDGLRFVIDTVVETPARTLELHGEPMVAVYDDFIQMGCMRISKSALKELSRYVHGLPDGWVANGLVIQPGNYPTNDPNTLNVPTAEGAQPSPNN